ncbi:hypothetical protein V1227_36775 [Lentzea sp. DG1S-22]|uniref:hypothetical protein n=1 Tax=Lentzea sp. DG1S-22 TaxID=3108822 RepID=UPI002E764F10|nr:hypothetical protein [Lentzea sp. DG1S-22]WVH80489.1 hypothetical protein V1227_36775 [Lentzea sp. DG1S-22]
MPRAAGRILLLDCCFSGGYGKGIKASTGGSVLDDRSGEGYVVLTASNAFEYAFEEEGLSLGAPRASVFTDVLLEGLSSGAADLNGDGWIDAQELFGYHAIPRCSARSPGRWRGRCCPPTGSSRPNRPSWGQVRRASVGECETVVVAHGYHPVWTPSVVAVLTVGVLGETALAERRRRLERAVLMVRLAAGDGVVLGGGDALAGAADVLDGSNPAHAALADALREPRRRIALNAGFDPSAAVEPVFRAVGVLSTAVGLAVQAAQRFLLLGQPRSPVR